MDVKVEIYKNRMVVSGRGKAVTVDAKALFTTNRLLVGRFTPAVHCLREGLDLIGAKSFLGFRKPLLLIIPCEMVDGGLSEIEERILREVGLSAGSGKVEVRPRD